MFVKKSMNWIDLLAIVPYFVTVTLNSYGVTEEALAVVSAGEEAGTGVEFLFDFSCKIVRNS